MFWSKKVIKLVLATVLDLGYIFLFLFIFCFFMMNFSLCYRKLKKINFWYVINHISLLFCFFERLITICVFEHHFSYCSAVEEIVVVWLGFGSWTSWFYVLSRSDFFFVKRWMRECFLGAYACKPRPFCIKKINFFRAMFPV